MNARRSLATVLRLVIPCGLAAVVACAPAAAPSSVILTPTPAPVRRVDDLIRLGCYRCLEQQLGEGDLPPDAEFQLAALLALRSKELGLPYTRWTAHAERVMPLDAEWRLYLDIVEAVRVDPLSGDREEILELTSRQRRSTQEIQRWRESLRLGEAAPLFRTYLDLTLACSTPERQAAVAQAEQRFGDAPLIVYRTGTCGVPSALAALRQRHPEYVDADLPLGRNALETTQPDQEAALQHFRAALLAFPDSPLVAASIGDVHRDREEWPEALAAYDATLALVPTHRDALLGRTIALSNLSRHEEAIASATRLLDYGNWFIGGAYFWRAWNHYNMGNIAAAGADVEQARVRGRGAPTLVLSGMVAWRQQRLDDAEHDFQASLEIDRGQCEAAALQGGVRAAQARWEGAAESFQHAQQCFDLMMAVRRKLIEDIQAGPGTPDGKAGQVARHQRAFEEAQRQRDDAARNLLTMRTRQVMAPR